MKVRAVSLIMLLSVVFGCDSDSEREVYESVELTHVVRFGDSRITDSPKRITVVRNQEQFRNEWPRVSSDVTPEIDFSSLFVVIAEMGYQSSGRGNIEVTDVLFGEKHAQVHVTTSVVGTGCDVTTALNAPYHIVSFPGSAKDVIIKEKYMMTDC